MRAEVTQSTFDHQPNDEYCDSIIGLAAATTSQPVAKRVWRISLLRNVIPRGPCPLCCGALSLKFTQQFSTNEEKISDSTVIWTVYE
jgi:hypothetical protein